MKIAILLYEGVDLRDSGGHQAVILIVSRLALRAAGSAPIELVAETLDCSSVAACDGPGIAPLDSLSAVVSVDVLIVSGTLEINGVLAIVSVLILCNF